MSYKSSDRLIERLLALPETGMGFQVIQTKSSKGVKKYLFINSIVGYEVEDNRPLLYKEAKSLDIEIDLSNLVVNASHGALEGRKQETSGSEIEKFVRLSAFENDFRVDRNNGRLLPGSFCTDLEDLLTLKVNRYIPNNYYCLPNEYQVGWMFYIKSIHGDSYQKGIVQPAFGKQGGGVEYFFENGTSNDTLISVSPF